MRAIGDLPALLHRLEDDCEGLLGDRTVRGQVVGRVQVDRIDVAGVDEAIDIDGLAGLDLDLLEFLVGDDDVFVLLELVALDQVGAVDLAQLRVMVLLLHAVERVLVQQVERDLAGGRRRRRIELHRTGDQRQLEITLPTRTPGHGDTPYVFIPTSRRIFGVILTALDTNSSQGSAARDFEPLDRLRRLKASPPPTVCAARPRRSASPPESPGGRAGSRTPPRSRRGRCADSRCRFALYAAPWRRRR